MLQLSNSEQFEAVQGSPFEHQMSLWRASSIGMQDQNNNSDNLSDVYMATEVSVGFCSDNADVERCGVCFLYDQCQHMNFEVIDSRQVT